MKLQYSTVLYTPDTDTEMNRIEAAVYSTRDVSYRTVVTVAIIYIDRYIYTVSYAWKVQWNSSRRQLMPGWKQHNISYDDDD